MEFSSCSLLGIYLHYSYSEKNKIYTLIYILHFNLNFKVLTYLIFIIEWGKKRRLREVN